MFIWTKIAIRLSTPCLWYSLYWCTIINQECTSTRSYISNAIYIYFRYNQSVGTIWSPYPRLRNVSMTPTGSPFLKYVFVPWALPDRGRGGRCKGLPWWFRPLFSRSKWAISCFFCFFSWAGGSEHLPGWFVHFLAHFGSVENEWKRLSLKKCSTVPIWHRGEGESSL